jgi:hypothetical protein
MCNYPLICNNHSKSFDNNKSVLVKIPWGRGEHPGVDNTWFHVQEETRSCFRGERLNHRHCSWISGRMVDILIEESVEEGQRSPSPGAPGTIYEV